MPTTFRSDKRFTYQAAKQLLCSKRYRVSKRAFNDFWAAKQEKYWIKPYVQYVTAAEMANWYTSKKHLIGRIL